MSLGDLYDEDEQWNMYNSLLNADENDDPFFSVDEIKDLLNKMDKELEEAMKQAGILEGYKEYKKANPLIPSELIKCECGAEKCKLPKHSDYCPKYKL